MSTPNFKEVELKEVSRQAVELTSDSTAGSRVSRQGRGFSAARAQRSRCPARMPGQRIKVVQRLPVRVTLDPKQLQKHPLRVGLSMNVDVDVSN